MLPTGFRTFHFVSFLYVLLFSFLFLLFRFFSHYFVFVFLRFIFFCFFSLLFSLFSFRFFFFPFLFVSFRFFPFLSLQVPIEVSIDILLVIIVCNPTYILTYNYMHHLRRPLCNPIFGINKLYNEYRTHNIVKSVSNSTINLFESHQSYIVS